MLAGTGTDNGAAQTVYATVQGAGALFVTNTSGTLVVRQTSNTSGNHFATLDLSGLSNFTAYVSQVLVGQSTSSGAVNRPDGKLLLATNNTIVCSASSSTIGVMIADSSQNAGNLGNEVDLGQTNAIFTDGGITVARQKSTGTLKFNPNNAPGSSLLLRNKAGTGPMNLWAIGDNAIGSSGSGSGDSGTVDLTGGTVDAQVTTIFVGRGQTAGTGTGKGVGTLKFSAGTIGASTVEIGYQLASGAAAATGTFDVDDTAQLFVTNNLRLGYYTSGSSVSSGTLNIGSITPGGTVTVTGQLLDGGGTGDSVSLTGGILSVGGIASSTVPLNKLTLNSGILNLNLTAAGNPATPVCNASTLNVNGAITLNLQGVGFTVGQFSLIKAYPGPIGGSAGANGFTLGTLPSRIGGYLSNNTANASIDLVITNVATPKWNGLTNGVPIGNWDIAITPDWNPTTGSGAITYLQSSVPGDAVLFDDTATGTTTVNLTTTLSPAAITVSNVSKTYTFTGSGSLSGPGALVKQGSALLAIINSGSNSFAGAISLNDGTVQLGGSSNELPVAAAVTLGTSGSAVLDLNNQNQTLGSLSGGGGGAGTVTLGSATLTIGGGGGVFDGVVSGTGQVVMNGSGTQVFTAANQYSGGTVISNGTLAVANSSGSGIGPGNLLIAPGGTLQLGNGGPAGSVAVTTITNNGLLVFDRSDDLSFTTPIVGSGAVAQIGTNIVTLPIANTYTGGTYIDNGPVRATNPNALGAASGTVNIQSPASARLELAGGVTLPQPLYLLAKASRFGASARHSEYQRHQHSGWADYRHFWWAGLDVCVAGRQARGAGQLHEHYNRLVHSLPPAAGGRGRRMVRQHWRRSGRAGSRLAL